MTSDSRFHFVVAMLWMILSELADPGAWGGLCIVMAVVHGFVALIKSRP